MAGKKSDRSRRWRVRNQTEAEDGGVRNQTEAEDDDRTEAVIGKNSENHDDGQAPQTSVCSPGRVSLPEGAKPFSATLAL